MKMAGVEGMTEGEGMMGVKGMKNGVRKVREA